MRLCRYVHFLIINFSPLITRCIISSLHLQAPVTLTSTFSGRCASHPSMCWPPCSPGPLPSSTPSCTPSPTASIEPPTGSYFVAIGISQAAAPTPTPRATPHGPSSPSSNITHPLATSPAPSWSPTPRQTLELHSLPRASASTPALNHFQGSSVLPPSTSATTNSPRIPSSPTTSPRPLVLLRSPKAESKKHLSSPAPDPRLPPLTFTESSSTLSSSGESSPVLLPASHRLSASLFITFAKIEITPVSNSSSLNLSLSESRN